MSQDRQAYAILNLDEGVVARAMWVTAITGSPDGASKVLQDLLAQAGYVTLSVIVDSPADPTLQSTRDAMGFDRPEIGGEFVVAECPI